MGGGGAGTDARVSSLVGTGETGPPPANCLECARARARARCQLGLRAWRLARVTPRFAGRSEALAGGDGGRAEGAPSERATPQAAIATAAAESHAKQQQCAADRRGLRPGGDAACVGAPSLPVWPGLRPGPACGGLAEARGGHERAWLAQTETAAGLPPRPKLGRRPESLEGHWRPSHAGSTQVEVRLSDNHEFRAVAPRQGQGPARRVPGVIREGNLMVTMMKERLGANTGFRPESSCQVESGNLKDYNAVTLRPRIKCQCRGRRASNRWQDSASGWEFQPAAAVANSSAEAG